MNFIRLSAGLALCMAMGLSANAQKQAAPIASGSKDRTMPAHAPGQPAKQKMYLSPIALSASADGKTLFIACATASRVLVFDTSEERVVKTIHTPASPSGLATSPDGSLLFVTCAAPQSEVCVIDTKTGKIKDKIGAGHTAMAPVCSPDGRKLYVCNRFNNSIGVISLDKGAQVCQIKVTREPVAAAITPDGRLLLVANHIHAGRSDADYVGSSVTIVDTENGRAVKDIPLPSGSTNLRDIRISPDGKLACVTHLMARFHLPTTQIERGWINNNALSIIDISKLEPLNTVLLDNIDSGAANPWGAAWSADGAKICVAHAGSHELSVIDAPALLKKLARASSNAQSTSGGAYAQSSNPADNIPNDLAFLVGVRQRIKLDQKGPRPVIFIGGKACVGNYFSDSITMVDTASPGTAQKTIPLAGEMTPCAVRQGELAFNDATLCFQTWQSCASCHSADARIDGLNWDLLNDGIGNPKNAKSLLLAHLTAPSMALGVRSNYQAAVRAGFRFIQFIVPPEKTAAAVDEYLQSLEVSPSPFLVGGKLSKQAARGKKIFMDKETRCASCHPQGAFTDLKQHMAGTAGKFDKPIDKFDTPTLVECWRTAPYLHDGSAATVRDVFTTSNKSDQHGKTSHLTPDQIDDLVAYVLSL